MDVNGQNYSVSYVPGDSDSGLFGGNSNWRGPIWIAVNFLLVESLLRFYMFYGNTFKVECPTGSGDYMHLGHVAEEIDPARYACCWLTEPHSHAPFTFASLTLSFLSNSFTSVLAFSIASFAPGQALRPRGVSNNLHACGEITPSISKL